MRSRAPVQALAALPLAALLLGALPARAALPGDSAPGPISPCVVDPASCPPAPPPPPPPPPAAPDPWEPVILGVYKLKVKGMGKRVANEAFEADGQFPILFLETEEGYAIPLEVVMDPFQDKIHVDVPAMAAPILETWLADRVQDLTGGVPVVTLTREPKAKFKEDSKLGLVIKFKFKGTVEVDGETRTFRYKGAFASLVH